MPAKQLPTPGPSRWGFLLFLSCTELSTLQGHGFLLICLSSRAVASLPMAFWEQMFEWHHRRDPWSLTMSSVYFMQNWHPNWELNSRLKISFIWYLQETDSLISSFLLLSRNLESKVLVDTPPKLPTLLPHLQNFLFVPKVLKFHKILSVGAIKKPFTLLDKIFFGEGFVYPRLS